MADSEIVGKASFDAIRYAQLWEDADVLLAALPRKPGATYVSICSAGDNALSLLTLDPARVVALDLSRAQIACLRLRMAAYEALTHGEFLVLMGARGGARDTLFDRVVAHLDGEDRALWTTRRDDALAYGIGGVGKFERYFRLMRERLLPFVHSRATVDAVFEPRPDRAARQQFLDRRWNNWRWRMLLKLFFSRTAMGRLGRDPAFFDHVEGSVADHVARRIVHAAVDLDPSQNSYLRWILKGDCGAALPHAWRAENYETIRARLDRIDARHGALEAFIATGEKADGFNLSDIFEYMTPQTASQVYGAILDACAPGARLVYWNMMAPRRLAAHHPGRAVRLRDVEDAGKAMDKAFFYSDFVVEEARERAV